MKVYLAHNYEARDWLAEKIVPELEAAGIEVTSSWIKKAKPIDPYHPDLQRTEAIQDIEDVRRADVIALFTNQFGKRPGRGKYVELGIALALDKTVILVGSAATNADTVFYYMPSIIKVSSLKQLIANVHKEEMINV